jgi:hypothetical protein
VVTGKTLLRVASGFGLIHLEMRSPWDQGSVPAISGG